MAKETFICEMKLSSGRKLKLKMKSIELSEIESIQEGKRIYIMFTDGQQFIFTFSGTTEDEIVVQPLESKSSFGFPLDKIRLCFVEVK
ncbi:hypothetical protein [Capnocytophaga catalasegens]|uniref:Uncharacterized protein n=1 Tax=Capnocytophaga catalasegens TaxID=1004260 RepID=A0AAV5AX08_9FLAO|nr:hypothetical protein [Capnocytophaga catalasegens]GIZ15280.1 hypothetical protein RCZ03_12800 [Capnocytophaga catalasegens]GJM51214.1 hypothetical protein RCZ15_21870 [Capnocytophaga catalasegens]GJM53008.1 hypothetical protein RCZ16_13250 [Capnocytophaga catalasegens]